MKTILFATDGSESAHEALDVAVELARDAGAELHVLSVHHPPVPARGAAASIPITETESTAGAERVAGEAADKARAAGVETSVHIAHGDVVDRIIKVADETGADMIVVGSRGLGIVGGAVLGSVSRRLVRRSKTPVTVVRPHAAVPV